MERISSRPLQDLMDDEIFGDFFNTFLNLPVFGQTPCYIPVLRRWELLPPLPSHKTPVHQGFISWLQKHRLQLFTHSDLCMHYLLCQQLLENPPRKKTSKEPKNVQTNPHDREDSIQIECENKFADHQLLLHCFGSVCGILQFRKFLCGTKGGELTSFWLIAAKILGLNENIELEKDLCHSLYRILKATHLSPDSAVLVTCSVNSSSMLQLMSGHHPKVRHDILKQMQTEAFWKIQHYWVPAYVSHYHVCLSKLPKEVALLEPHQQAGLRNHELLDNQAPSIQGQKWTSEKYSSKENKKQMWHLMTCGVDIMDLKLSNRDITKSAYLENNSCVNRPGQEQRFVTPEQPNLTDSKPLLHFEFPFFSLARHHTPVINLFPPTDIEYTKLTSDWLHWALKAEGYAGHPFYSFLIATGRREATQLVDLWQDLADLHSVLQSDRNLELCILLTERFFLHCAQEIMEVPNTFGSIQSTRLGAHIAPLTMTQLMELLPCREAMPSVLQAQYELSQSLRSHYEQFLDVEDNIFLHFVTCSNSDPISSKPESLPMEDKREHIIHRFRTVLCLAEACSPAGDIKELNLEGLNLLQTEDHSKDSTAQTCTPFPSIHRKANYNTMSFEDLALWNPKMAVGMLSKQFQVYSKDGTALFPSKSNIQQCRGHIHPSVQSIRKQKILLHKPSTRPRTLYEVLHDPVHLEFFRQYLRMNHSEEPLIFWLTVKRLGAMSNPKQEQAYIEIILQHFFQKNPGKLLQCDAVIIEVIPKMSSVSTSILQSAQAFVFKSMDEKWFKEYQDTFPDSWNPGQLPVRSALKSVFMIK
ncbi:regulator of G-protein signaling protein-like [Pyxicephalus adspersus]